MRKPMIALLLALASAGAAAQGVYKYTDKDGRVVYTDDPKAGGGQARAVPDQSSRIPAPSGLDAASRQLLNDADQRSAALDRAMDEVIAAHGALREAEVRRDAAMEPIEGERQGRRFRDEYWYRQEALQRDIDNARTKLSDALARRNALK